MKSLALITAVAATGHDDDLVPLLQACAQVGLQARVVAWDDATVSWRRFDAVLLRSPWDYTERLAEFLIWCDRVEQSAQLLNPLRVVRWNTDKHYLADLAKAGVSVVSTAFVEPDAEPLQALHAFWQQQPAAEFVIKPTVSAGARDTQRYARTQEFAASNHIARLLEQAKSVMLQPYLDSVDDVGETALVYFNGQFSHAIRKGALLHREQPAIEAPYATSGITARDADPDERALAELALSAVERLLQLEQPLPYARIDLIRDDQGLPTLLEMELTEPSLFFAQALGSADRFATVLARRVGS